MYKDPKRLKEDLEAYYALVEKLKKEKSLLRRTLLNLRSTTGTVEDPGIRKIFYDEIDKAIKATEPKEEF